MQYSQQIVSLVLSLSSISLPSLWHAFQLSGMLCQTLGQHRAAKATLNSQPTSGMMRISTVLHHHIHFHGLSSFRSYNTYFYFTSKETDHITYTFRRRKTMSKIWQPQKWKQKAISRLIVIDALKSHSQKLKMRDKTQP